MGLGSGIQDPGSRGQKGTGSRIRIRKTCKQTHAENLQRAAWGPAYTVLWLLR